MKIVFLTRLFYPHIGGVEKHVMELSKQLVKLGNEVVVITTKYNSSLSNIEEFNKIKIIRFKQPRIKIIGLFFTWIWLLNNRDIFFNSKIIHIHDVFIWYLPFKILYPWRKVYTTFHGWETVYPIPIYFKLQKKIAVWLSTKTICVGDYIGRFYGFKPDFITYGAVNTKLLSKTKKDSKKIVYLGRLDSDTGLPILIKAAQKLKGFKIDFCGNGKLADDCRKIGVVRGFVDPAKFLKKASICIASGYLSVLEAISYKCLVVVIYDNPLKQEYYQLSPLFKYVFKITSANEFNQLISVVGKHKDKIKKGYKWVKKQTWENLTSNYIKLWSN